MIWFVNEQLLLFWILQEGRSFNQSSFGGTYNHNRGPGHRKRQVFSFDSDCSLASWCTLTIVPTLWRSGGTWLRGSTISWEFLGSRFQGIGRRRGLWQEWTGIRTFWTRSRTSAPSTVSKRASNSAYPLYPPPNIHLWVLAKLVESKCLPKYHIANSKIERYKVSGKFVCGIWLKPPSEFLPSSCSHPSW